MESREEEECPKSETKRKGFRAVLFRFSLVFLFPMFAFLSLSVLIGVFVLTAPISVASQCKIVSSSVDIRSSKVCELGLLNYNAKHVFYSSERRKFGCRYDYYWASNFKVEYKDDLSGQRHVALAEAPNEALPLECRPNFGIAYLTKEKFKVYTADPILVLPPPGVIKQSRGSGKPLLQRLLEYQPH